jgi:hypothetical protein
MARKLLLGFSAICLLVVGEYENTAYYGFFLDTTTLNEVSWDNPAMDRQVSYLEYKAKMGQAYLFLKRGDPSVVTVITRSEYLSIAGTL